MTIKRFLLISCIALLVAVSCAVGIFIYLQYQFYRPAEVVELPPPIVTGDDSRAQSVEIADVEDPEFAQNSADTLVEPEAIPASVEPSGIPLRNLPLDESQKDLLGQFNIDYDTFVITDTMIKCARNGMGDGRFDEIVAGSAPSFLESLKLFNCTR